MTREDKIGLLIGCIISTSLVIAALVLMLFPMARSMPNLFTGSEKFNTVEEATGFYEELRSYSETNGYYLSTNIRIESPPKVTYRIRTSNSWWPDETCNYGERKGTEPTMSMIYILFFLIIVIVPLGPIAWTKGAKARSKDDS